MPIYIPQQCMSPLTKQYLSVPAMSGDLEFNRQFLTGSKERLSVIEKFKFTTVQRVTDF